MRWQLWTTWLLNFRNWATIWETSADTRTRFHDRKTTMMCFFCHSFCRWDGNNSNATTPSINILLYSAVLVVGFLQSSGCVLRFLPAFIAYFGSWGPDFLKESYYLLFGIFYLVFVRWLSRISSACTCVVGRGAREAPGWEETPNHAAEVGAGPSLSPALTSEARSQSEGASAWYWPIGGAVRQACQWWEAEVRAGCHGREHHGHWGAAGRAGAWGGLLGRQALYDFNSVLIACRVVGVRSWE